jgi:hypothetical protein
MHLLSTRGWSPPVLHSKPAIGPAKTGTGCFPPDSARLTVRTVSTAVMHVIKAMRTRGCSQGFSRYTTVSGRISALEVCDSQGRSGVRCEQKRDPTCRTAPGIAARRPRRRLQGEACGAIGPSGDRAKTARPAPEIESTLPPRYRGLAPPDRCFDLGQPAVAKRNRGGGSDRIRRIGIVLSDA